MNTLGRIVTSTSTCCHSIHSTAMWNIIEFAEISAPIFEVALTIPSTIKTNNY